MESLTIFDALQPPTGGVVCITGLALGWPFCFGDKCHRMKRINGTILTTATGISLERKGILPYGSGGGEIGMTQIPRRRFLRLTGAVAGVALLGSGCSGQPAEPAPTRPAVAVPTGDQAYLAVARGADPAEITRRAVVALGGIERFVKPGHEVMKAGCLEFLLQ